MSSTIEAEARPGCLPARAARSGKRCVRRAAAVAERTVVAVRAPVLSSVESERRVRPAGGGRRMMASGAVALVVLAALVVLGDPVATFADAASRAAQANPAWLLLGAAAEAASFAGYIALFALVAGVNARTSYEVTLGGAAVTRLLPTAGVGGVAFTVVALRRLGATTGAAAGIVLRFLVVLYAVFLMALLGAALLVAAGGHGSWAVIPAGAVALAMGAALALGLRAGPGRGTRLGRAVREAGGVVRRGDTRLAGAVVWWGFDVAVLWATLNAVGHPPELSVLLLAYFLGAVGNTIPVPGAMSGGMISVLVALAVPADAAIAGVLAYRLLAVWLPAPFGLLALASMRRAQPVEAASSASVTDLPPSVGLHDRPAPGEQRARRAAPSPSSSRAPRRRRRSAAPAT